MILYHGSTEIVEKPKILISTHFLDFGFGFYTTSSIEQATRWADTKRKRTQAQNSYLNIYEIDDCIFGDKNFSFLVFENADREWLKFVIDNRRGTIKHDFDFVKGAVANDTLYQTFTLYESGIITFDEAIIRLKTTELFNQISFHTEKALKNLKFKEIRKLNI
jgi:hypothetical protein